MIDLHLSAFAPRWRLLYAVRIDAYEDHKKNKYPPEGIDDAVQTVMSQCEMWTDNIMTA